MPLPIAELDDNDFDSFDDEPLSHTTPPPPLPASSQHRMSIIRRTSRRLSQDSDLEMDSDYAMDDFIDPHHSSSPSPPRLSIDRSSPIDDLPSEYLSRALRCAALKLQIAEIQAQREAIVKQFQLARSNNNNNNNNNGSRNNNVTHKEVDAFLKQPIILDQRCIEAWINGVAVDDSPPPSLSSTLHTFIDLIPTPPLSFIKSIVFIQLIFLLFMFHISYSAYSSQLKEANYHSFCHFIVKSILTFFSFSDNNNTTVQ